MERGWGRDEGGRTEMLGNLVSATHCTDGDTGSHAGTLALGAGYGSKTGRCEEDCGFHGYDGGICLKRGMADWE